MADGKLHPVVAAVKQILEGMSHAFGSRYEWILHDLSQVENSIVAVYGNVTNRKAGGPATNYLLQMIKTYGDEAPDSIGYKNVLPDGRVLRSSTLFLRDAEGHIVGSLCVNQDMTDYLVADKLISEMVSFALQEEAESPGELFAHEIGDVMEAMVLGELELMQKPVAYMQKEDKLALVERLESKGIFDVKGSVEYVAERLGVTNFTV